MRKKSQIDLVNAHKLANGMAEVDVFSWYPLDGISNPLIKKIPLRLHFKLQFDDSPDMES